MGFRVSIQGGDAVRSSHEEERADDARPGHVTVVEEGVEVGQQGIAEPQGAHHRTLCCPTEHRRVLVLQHRGAVNRRARTITRCAAPLNTAGS